MATFELIDDATYRIEGDITQEDVERINSFKIRTNLILSNTKGQLSEIIEQINTDNVYFSIVGGLDYFEKEKYNNKEYIERTQLAPKGLAKVLEYFETIESEMNPEWTDTQKCMYAYNALAVDIDYVTDLEQDILSTGVTERGLNGVLYKQLTCAGMAQTFKEMMDRLGINCYYQNQKSVHAFNVVELDGKLRGIDVTWDCTKTDDEKCSFKNFGRDPNFYQKHGHRISADREETVFDLTTFTEQEILDNYAVIESTVNKRMKIVNDFRNFDTDRKRNFLPVDRFKEELEEEKKIIMELKLLNQMGIMPEEMLEFTRERYGFISDYLGDRYMDIGIDASLEKIAQSNELEGKLIMKDNQVLFLHYSQDGERIEEPLAEEQSELMSGKLMEDVKKYYTQYFFDGKSQIDEMIETLSMLDNIPPEISNKTATLRAQLFTKIKLFSNADSFFEELGIPKEEVEAVSSKAKSYLDRSREENESEITETRHNNDLDFLYAIIQNDIVNIMAEGREYSEEDLAKLMDDVRTNWAESQFSDEEFKQILDEALGKTIDHNQITRDTINAGAGLQEANDVAVELRKTQTRDLQQAQVK